MKVNYTTTEKYGETVPAIEYNGVKYPLAEYTGETVGRIHHLYHDVEKDTFGMLIDSDDYDEKWWMPLEPSDWWKMRRCYATDPKMLLYLETVYSKKKGCVRLLNISVLVPNDCSDEGGSI